jgi:hypothetical protein
MKIETIWPWGGLVPTIIEVTPKTVEITYRQLLGTSQQITIELREIHSVECDRGLFFSQITFLFAYEDERTCIKYLLYKDALAVKELIEHLKENVPVNNTK